MKVLYILRSVSHYPYHASIIRNLITRKHEVQLLFDKKWSRGTVENKNRVNVGWLTPRRDGWRPLLYVIRELRSFVSYLSRPNQSVYYRNRWRGYLPLPLRFLVRIPGVCFVLSQKLFQQAFRMLEQLIPTDAAIDRELKALQPDVVVVSPGNLRYSEEIEYVKSARRLGISTTIPVISWDNLTTKGLFHAHPDLTLVWNETQRQEAITIHSIPNDAIVVTGSPFFDKWFDIDGENRNRKIFYTRVGLDPKRKYIVYLGSSENIARDETWIIHELCKHLKNDDSLRQIIILVRPHPANVHPFRRLKDPNIVVWPKEGALPSSAETIFDFYDSIRFSEAVIGINTSGMIDAVVLDKPTITILTSRYTLTQSQANHFQSLLESGVLDVANDPKDCVKLLSRLLTNGDKKHDLRDRFVEEFVRPLGLKRNAGSVAALAIELLGKGMKGKEISEILRNNHHRHAKK